MYSLYQSLKLIGITSFERSTDPLPLKSFPVDSGEISAGSNDAIDKFMEVCFLFSNLHQEALAKCNKNITSGNAIALAAFIDPAFVGVELDQLVFQSFHVSSSFLRK